MNLILSVSDSDGFAITMLAILLTSFSFVLLILVGVVRNARKHGRESEEAVEETQTHPAGDAPDEKKPEPWEKSADWWKGEP